MNGSMREMLDLNGDHFWYAKKAGLSFKVSKETLKRARHSYTIDEAHRMGAKILRIHTDGFKEAKEIYDRAEDLTELGKIIFANGYLYSYSELPAFGSRVQKKILGGEIILSGITTIFGARGGSLFIILD